MTASSGDAAARDYASWDDHLNHAWATPCEQAIAKQFLSMKARAFIDLVRPDLFIRGGFWDPGHSER